MARRSTGVHRLPEFMSLLEYTHSCWSTLIPAGDHSFLQEMTYSYRVLIQAGIHLFRREFMVLSSNRLAGVHLLLQEFTYSSRSSDIPRIRQIKFTPLWVDLPTTLLLCGFILITTTAAQIVVFNSNSHAASSRHSVDEVHLLIITNTFEHNTTACHDILYYIIYIHLLKSLIILSYCWFQSAMHQSLFWINNLM